MDTIIVKVGGIEYPTIIDEHGTQRFIAHPLLSKLCDANLIDLNGVAVAYARGKVFTQREYIEFNMALGYSVCGLAELHEFENVGIENHLWDKKGKLIL